MILLLLPFSLARCLDMPLMDGKPQPVFEVSRRVFFFCSNDLELDCGLSKQARGARGDETTFTSKAKSELLLVSQIDSCLRVCFLPARTLRKRLKTMMKQQRTKLFHTEFRAHLSR
jgi:hypothetical protein